MVDQAEQLVHDLVVASSGLALTGDDTMAVSTQQISEVDLARVRELKRVAVQCLTEINAILAPHVEGDVTTASAVKVSLFAEPAAAFDGVPPVYQDPVHVVYGPGGACLYVLEDPPGICRPCD